MKLAHKIDNSCRFFEVQYNFTKFVEILMDNESNHMILSEMETLIREKLQDRHQIEKAGRGQRK